MYVDPLLVLQDAVWISPGNTLRCTTPAEIILLLKSSDFISHDLSLLEDTNTETGSHDGETGSQDGSITDLKTGSDDDSIKTGSDDDSIKTGSQDVCSVTLLDSNSTDISHDQPAHMVCECVCVCVVYPFYVCCIHFMWISICT